MTDCVTEYIHFCLDNTILVKRVRCFPNNKPWVTPKLKALLNEKKRVFRSGDMEQLRRVHKEVKREIRKGRDNYRRRLEECLQSNNISEAWRGQKTLSGDGETPQKRFGSWRHGLG